MRDALSLGIEGGYTRPHPNTSAVGVLRAGSWSSRFRRSSGRQRVKATASIRLARLTLERMTALHTTVLIATFRCDAPTRVAARRSVAATRAGARGSEMLIQPLGSQSPAVPSPRGAARHAIPRRAAGRRRLCVPGRVVRRGTCDVERGVRASVDHTTAKRTELPADRSGWRGWSANG
jgi:hypothetical protein